MRKLYLAAECLALTVALPLYLYFAATRPIMLTALWGGGLMCWLWLRSKADMRRIWQGHALTSDMRRLLIIRFLVMTAAALSVTALWAPERLFAFPMQRPEIWLMVMLLYPLLSALPRELIYRAFFMQRYAPLVPSVPVLATISAIAFGLSHLMMNNVVAPVLSILGGLIFAHTYVRTGSLKWAVIEHAAYGCMLFTVGLGWYFYIGNWR